jgi:hypothetical protein
MEREAFSVGAAFAKDKINEIEKNYGELNNKLNLLKTKEYFYDKFYDYLISVKDRMLNKK